MDEGTANVGFFFLYLAIGVAVGFGGWKHWGRFGRTVFFLIFPIQALLGVMSRDVWPYVSPEGDRKVPWILAGWIILFFLMIAVCAGG